MQEFPVHGASIFQCWKVLGSAKLLDQCNMSMISTTRMRTSWDGVRDRGCDQSVQAIVNLNSQYDGQLIQCTCTCDIGPSANTTTAYPQRTMKGEVRITRAVISLHVWVLIGFVDYPIYILCSTNGTLRNCSSNKRHLAIIIPPLSNHSNDAKQTLPLRSS